MQISAFPIPDAIRFFTLWLGYSLQVGRYFKGFTEKLMHKKNCIHWSKSRCLWKTTMGWESGNEGENQTRWLSEDIMCRTNDQQPEQVKPPSRTNHPGPRSWSAGRRETLAVPTALHFNSISVSILFFIWRLPASALCSLTPFPLLSGPPVSSASILYDRVQMLPPQLLSFDSKTLWF